MTGPARSLCYRLAAATGLRYSEIASIMPESFDWEAPSVTVAACYTKNGDPATLPLPRDLADRPGRLRGSAEPEEPVFPLPTGKGAKMLRRGPEGRRHPLSRCLGAVLRLPQLAMRDGDPGRCRWGFAAGCSDASCGIRAWS